MKKEKVLQIIKKLEEHYPDSKCSLEFSNPVELLIATILSAQCTDKQVNRVTPVLFEKYQSVEAFVEADLEDIKQIVRPTGFYNTKQKLSKKVCNHCRKNFTVKFLINSKI